MDNEKLANWILGMVDMSIASEFSKEEQLQMMREDLNSIKETNLYYYLVSAYENINK